MSTLDDWDRRYRETHIQTEPVKLLIELAEFLPPGRALDVACGAGRNALHLARLGWTVTAVDGSAEAIALLRQQAARETLTVDAHLADLEHGEFSIAPESCDLICDFFYLQRDLFAAMRAGVRPGGVFAAVLHLRTEGLVTRHPQFLLEPGELREEFRDWKILRYSECPPRDGHRRATASLVARRA